MTLAERADRHVLYEESVQDVAGEYKFVNRTFNKLRDRKARSLREDFCGTAGMCCEWVKRRRENTAIGVDLDSEVLAWAHKHNLARLEPDVRQRVTLVQATPGEIRAEHLQDDAICLQPGAYVASTPGLKLGLRYAGLGSFIGREGLFKLLVSGTGTLWYGAYGGLLEKNVRGQYIVDTAHLVAYRPHMKLKAQLAGGIFSSFFGGEGLVTRVEGDGTIVIQTRSLSGLAGWLNPKL